MPVMKLGHVTLEAKHNSEDGTTWFWTFLVHCQHGGRHKRPRRG